MILLAADTSTSMGSVALRDREGMIQREWLDGSRPHSETLLPAVEKILARVELDRKDVQAVAVGTGPGAFTGLRVGLATFKAWAAAAGLSLIPVVSMDAVALPVLREGNSAMVVADARKGEVYAAYYPSLEENSLPCRQGDVALLPNEGVPEWFLSLNDPAVYVTGTGLLPLTREGLLDDLKCNRASAAAPDAIWILELAEILLSLDRTVEPEGLVPCYVRPPDARKTSTGSMVTNLTDDDHSAGRR